MDFIYNGRQFVAKFCLLFAMSTLLTLVSTPLHASDDARVGGDIVLPKANEVVMYEPGRVVPIFDPSLKAYTNNVDVVRSSNGLYVDNATGAIVTGKVNVYDASGDRIVRSFIVKAGKRGGMVVSYFNNGSVRAITEARQTGTLKYTYLFYQGGQLRYSWDADDYGNGYVTHYYIDGALKADMRLVGNKLEGPAYDYSEGGITTAIYQYKGGELHGLQELFTDNGTQRAVINFKMGVVEGLFIEYYASGDIYIEGTYKDDELDGVLWVYREDKTLWLEADVEMGDVLRAYCITGGKDKYELDIEMIEKPDNIAQYKELCP